MKNNRTKCVICGSEQLEKLKMPELEAFSTGDGRGFKSWNREIKRVICGKCGFVQFMKNEDYKQVGDEVFGSYQAMHDKVFSDKNSDCNSKLDYICKMFAQGGSNYLPLYGKMLDVGCGSGELFYWFNRTYPDWELYGFDIFKQFKDEILQKRGVKGFFVSLNELRESDIKFDFIVLKNMLCTVYNPSEILESVYAVLKDDGFIFVLDSDFQIQRYQMCCIINNLYFTAENIKSLLRRFRFDLIDHNFEIEKKELAVLARKSISSVTCSDNLYKQNKQIYNENVDYLNHVIDVTKGYVKNRNCLGIFGMSVAGVWLSEIITNHIKIQNNQKIFYIDEDEDVISQKIGANGYPIYRLEEVGESAAVFLPFPQYVSDRIKHKYENKYNHIEFIDFT